MIPDAEDRSSRNYKVSWDDGGANDEYFSKELDAVTRYVELKTSGRQGLYARLYKVSEWRQMLP